MARVQGVAVQDGVALASGVAKTVIQVIAAANHRVAITGIVLGSQSIASTDVPILVEIALQTDGGTSSALTPAKRNPGDAETLLTTARHTATVEPATTSAQIIGRFHPQPGLVIPLEGKFEYFVGGGQRAGLRLTSGNTESVTAGFLFEE